MSEEFNEALEHYTRVLTERAIEGKWTAEDVGVARRDLFLAFKKSNAEADRINDESRETIRMLKIEVDRLTARRDRISRAYDHMRDFLWAIVWDPRQPGPRNITVGDSVIKEVLEEAQGIFEGRIR